MAALYFGISAIVWFLNLVRSEHLLREEKIREV